MITGMLAFVAFTAWAHNQRDANVLAAMSVPWPFAMDAPMPVRVASLEIDLHGLPQAETAYRGSCRDEMVVDQLLPWAEAMDRLVIWGASPFTFRDCFNHYRRRTKIHADTAPSYALTTLRFSCDDSMERAAIVDYDFMTEAAVHPRDARDAFDEYYGSRDLERTSVDQSTWPPLSATRSREMTLHDMMDDAPGAESGPSQASAARAVKQAEPALMAPLVADTDMESATLGRSSASRPSLRLDPRPDDRKRAARDAVPHGGRPSVAGRPMAAGGSGDSPGRPRLSPSPSLPRFPYLRELASEYESRVARYGLYC